MGSKGRDITMAREPRRSAAVDPPRIPVTTHEGIVKMVQVAHNIRGALEYDDDGEIIVVQSYKKKGWIKLEDLYLQEGRPDLWAAWKAHREAVEKARRDGLSIPGFPDKYLPREVQRRRAGHRPQATTWTMPDLPPVDLDAPLEDEEVPMAPPVKGKAKRGTGGPAPAASPALEA